MHLVSYMAPGIPASLFALIAEIIDADLELVETTSGPLPGDNPFADGRADLGWMCSTSFAELGDPDNDPTVALVGIAWVPDDPDANGEPVYFGDLVAADGNSTTRLADLAGARIGCNDPVSLSGFHALRVALRHLGHDIDDFCQVVFTGGHNRSLDMVLAGELDTAVVDSVCRTRRSRSEPAVANLRVIDRLGPWPTQPLVARSSMDTAEVARIRETIVAANQDPRIQAELAAAAMTKLVAVDPAHYVAVREALK